MPAGATDALPVVFGARPSGGRAPAYLHHYNGRIDSPTLLPCRAGDADLAQLRVEAARRRWPPGTSACASTAT
ncbi:hypothetical protein [Bordetella parapertussis]|uniref:Uncharacterized protein n=1 Tax=Bordetella parapertussis TaxID=519 RepID=A0ABU5X8Y4_BORPP|nr:hypothetical protein [Bordetella parapertussis]MEB2661188.1 hypothetical protein [Bordetella parapertussis]MEB2665312.1 hypothetical protein [Bordetella parapertussis]MEB2668214.1 hypothetical protein [Bordetella parapertussis]UEB03110.1 hypothetical protein LK409_12085 [Bordetella parapertussis]UEB16433.1 hypothetical protein LK435_19775 [Bordetella parapertussis]